MDFTNFSNFSEFTSSLNQAPKVGEVFKVTLEIEVTDLLPREGKLSPRMKTRVISATGIPQVPEAEERGYSFSVFYK